jgi:hypothetical protein
MTFAIAAVLLDTSRRYARHLRNPRFKRRMGLT